MAGFISEFVREQKRYTKNELRDLFSFSVSEVDAFIQRLKLNCMIVKTIWLIRGVYILTR